MDKELALAFEFENAPESLKKAAETHRNNWLRLEKAKSQVAKWNAESIEANKAFAESHKIFKSELNAWDPADTRKPDLEDANSVRGSR